MRTPEATVTEATAAATLRTLLAGQPVGIVGLGGIEQAGDGRAYRRGAVCGYGDV